MLEVVTPAGSHDLTTLAAVKAELQIIDAAQDAFLAGLIRQASSMVHAYCNRVLVAETVRQTFRLDRPCPSLILTRYPVVSIVSVMTDGATLAGDEAEIDKATGTLWRLAQDHRVDWNARKVVIQYMAGYTEVPPDIERAVIDLVKAQYFARNRDPNLRAETLLDGTIDQQFQVTATAPQVGGLPADIAARLAPYRVPGLA